MNRRDFLKTSVWAAGVSEVPGAERASAAAEALTIPFQGDLPFQGDMVRRPGGRLILMGQGVRYAVSDDGGRRWSQPRSLLTSSKPDQGLPVQSDSDVLGLRFLPSGDLVICYGRWRKAGNRRRQEIIFRTSIDEGRSWLGEISMAPLPGDDLYALHGSLTRLQSGRLILPAYTKFSHDYVGRGKGLGSTWLPEYSATHMLYSDDQGQSWDHGGALFHWKGMGYGGSAPCGQACLAETQDGRLLMLAQSTNMRVLRVYSSDEGESWTMVETTDLHNADTPVRLARIPSTGDLLLVWNQVTAQEQRSGYGRGRLSTAISRDSGQSWTYFKTLELSPGMRDIRRVADPEPAHFVRAGEATRPGQTPQNPANGFMESSRPSIHFFDGYLYIDHQQWFRPNAWAGESERRDIHQKLHILPVEQLYA